MFGRMGCMRTVLWRHRVGCVVVIFGVFGDCEVCLILFECGVAGFV